MFKKKNIMKCIVIAAGYATRLGELTKNFPKPLLKIGENTILGRMLDDIDRIPEIDEHIIITNHKFAPIFEEWVHANTLIKEHESNESNEYSCHSSYSCSKYTKPITVVDDGTETNETRLGAVCRWMTICWWWRRITCCSSRFRSSWTSRRRSRRVASCAMNSRRQRNYSGRVSWNWMSRCGCWGWRRSLRCRRVTGLCRRSISS